MIKTIKIWEDLDGCRNINRTIFVSYEKRNKIKVIDRDSNNTLAYITDEYFSLSETIEILQKIWKIELKSEIIKNEKTNYDFLEEELSQLKDALHKKREEIERQEIHLFYFEKEVDKLKEYIFRTESEYKRKVIRLNHQNENLRKEIEKLSGNKENWKKDFISPFFRLLNK
ncbi:MAG: hypothetical protein WCR79_05010 [Fusobacterium sp.]